MKNKLSILLVVLILLSSTACHAGGSITEKTDLPTTEDVTVTSEESTAAPSQDEKSTVYEESAAAETEVTEAQSTSSETESVQETAASSENVEAETEGARYIFDGEYSNMPEVKEYKDRLPDELKVYRSMLTDKEKEVYDLLLPYALSFTDFAIDLNDVKKNGFTIDEMFAGGRAINEDYPETWIYWCAAYKDFTPPFQHSDGIYGEFANFGSLFWGLSDPSEYNEKESKANIKKLLKKSKYIISQMPEGLTTKEKYLWIADYICNTTYYPPSTKDRGSFYADGPILRGKGICQGYAYAYQLLCQEAGLWCIIASGGVHVWNVVKLDDGLTYYMDLTWQDGNPEENYYYFMSYERCLATGHSFYEGEWIADGVEGQGYNK